MGRSKRPNIAAATDIGRRGQSEASSSMVLTKTLQEVNEVFPYTDEVETYLATVSHKAQRSLAGAQGRLFAALDDISNAQQLAMSSDPSEQQLAQTMTDNALWYVGRIISAFDKNTKAPYLGQLQSVLRQWGNERGPGQIDYLQSQGLLPSHVTQAQIDDWKNRAGELYEEAFSSSRSFFAKKGDRPVWNALSILERAGKARQQIIDTPEPEAGSDADGMRETALKRAELLIKQAHTYIGDLDNAKETYDSITPFGPEGATQVEAIAAALSNPKSRHLNNALQNTGTIAKHSTLVQEGTGKDPSTDVLAVADQRWLRQISIYNGYGSEHSGTIQALSVGATGIFLSPESAHGMLANDAMGSFDELATHELIHRTQARQPKGNPLKDIAHPHAQPGLKKRHVHFEAQLLEAATQGLACHLRRQHDGSYDGQPTEVYPTFTAMADELCRSSKMDPTSFYKEFSATPTYQRTAFIAKALTGRDDEKTQRDLFETLLTLNMRAEKEAATAGFMSDDILGRHRKLVADVVDKAASSR